MVTRELARPLGEALSDTGIGLLALRRSSRDASWRLVECNADARAWLEFERTDPDRQGLDGLLAARGDVTVWAELILALERGAPLRIRLDARPGRRPELDLVGRPSGRDGYWLLLLPVAGLPADREAADDRLASLDAVLREPVYALALDLDCRLVVEWTLGPVRELTGHSADSGATWSDWIEPAERVVWRDRNVKVLGGAAASCRYHMRTVDGAAILVEDHAAPRRDARGATVGLVARVTPISSMGTAQPEADAIVRALAARTKAALVALVDDGGRLTVQLHPASGPPSDPSSEPQLLEETLRARLIGARQQLAALLEQADDDTATMSLDLDDHTAELVRLADDGALVLIHPVDRFEPSGINETSSHFDDEPPDHAPLWSVLETVVDGLVACNARGMVQGLSAAAERLFEKTAAEVSGHPLDLLLGLPVGDETDLLATLDDAADQPVRLTELLARRTAGELVPVEVTVSRRAAREPNGLLLTVRDMTARREAEETIRRLASRDPLTGLPNRLLFDDRLTQTVERARRNPQEFAVMLLDLDRFKLVNESLGMAKGDQLLREVARRLVTVLRRSDTVARLGGDEFLVLLPGCRGAENAAKVAQKVLDVMRQPFAIDGQELTATASAGIALFPHDGGDAETLMRNADTALYRTKEQGRNSYQFYTTDMNARAFERLVLETQLRRALERGELMLHYQPLVSARTGEITGVEALVRWFHPELGRVPPGEFIPIAEETGLILPIGQWVMTEACRQVREWQRAGFPELRIAVNLSSRQFKQRNLVDIIRRVLQATQMPSNLLELELTESAIMEDVDESVSRLQAIHDLGVQFAVDDFGTGYSSLAYLKRFPIRWLKIDRSFVKDVTTDANDAAIAQAIVALAERMRISVIAEGVETREQLAMIRQFGCDELQGFLFSGPLPPDETLELLRSGKRLDVEGVP